MLAMTNDLAGISYPRYSSSDVTACGTVGPISVVRRRVQSQQSRTEVHDGIPPEHLLHDRHGIRQSISVGKFRELVWADNGVNFRLRFGLDVGVERHGEEEPRQRGGCLTSAPMLDA